MRVRSVVVFVLPLAVGACVRASRCCDPCATPSARTAAERPVALAPAPPPGEAKPVTAPKPGASIETLRLEAALLVKDLERLAPASRGMHVADALAREPRLVEGLPPETWAGLAPDSLRVYDVSRLVEVAPDLPIAVLDPLAPGGDSVGRPPADAPNPRIARLADDLRTRFAQASVYVHPTGAVLVATSPTLAGALDALVERAARVGTGVARLEVDALEHPDEAARRLGVGSSDGPWKAGAALPEPGTMGAAEPPVHVRADAPTLAATPSRLGVAVPSGSRVGACRTRRVAYLQDFEKYADPSLPAADPIVGTIETGLVANVTHRPDVGEGPGSLVVELAWSELVEPIPTFQTTLTTVDQAVTIDLPEVRLVRGSIALPAVAGAAAFVDLKVVALHVRVASIEATASATGPLVRRIVAGEARPRQASVGDVVTFRVGVGRPAAPTGTAFPGPSPAPAPTITTELGSEASLAATDPVAYVQDFDVERATGGVIASPIVATASPGIEVRVRPRRADGGRVVVATTVRIEDLDRPMRKVRVPLGVGAPVTIEFPSARFVVESSIDSFAPGETRGWSFVGPAGVADPVRVELRYEDGSAKDAAPAPAALPVPAK